MDASKLKSEIHDIINNALSGDEKYRHNQDKNSYIRWGRVGKDIDAAIDRHLTPAEAGQANCIHLYKESCISDICICTGEACKGHAPAT